MAAKPALVTTDPAPAPIMASFRPETASPSDVEQLIDARIDQIDDQIQKHQAALEELKAERKRWLGVTGGRSRGALDE